MYGRFLNEIKNESKQKNTSSLQKITEDVYYDNNGITEILDVLFQKLEELIHLSLNSKNHASLQITLLESLVNVARYFIVSCSK